MSGPVKDSLDLSSLALLPGQACSLTASPPLDDFQLGGQTYRPSQSSQAGILDISRTLSGYALRLRIEAGVEGPCARCLEPTRVDVTVDAREIDQHDVPDDELTSPYVEADVISVGRWANDALVLATPAVPVCSADCAGLCAECGKRLAVGEEHSHAGKGDPRLAKLGEIDLD